MSLIPVDKATKMIMLLQALPNLSNHQIMQSIDRLSKQNQWSVQALKALHDRDLTTAIDHVNLAPLIDQVNCDVQWCQNHRIHLLNYLNPQYPHNLRLTLAGHQPPLLYVAGDYRLLNQSLSVLCRGTMTPTPAGIQFTQRLVQYFVHNHVTILTTLNNGLDTITTQATIANGGHPVIVLNQGFKSPLQPANHRSGQFVTKFNHRQLGDGLAEAVLRTGGVIISPYAIHQPYRQPTTETAMQQAQLQVACSDSVLVPEIRLTPNHQITGMLRAILDATQQQHRGLMLPNWLALHRQINTQRQLPMVQQGCLHVMRTQIATPITNHYTIENALHFAYQQHQTRWGKLPTPKLVPLNAPNPWAKLDPVKDWSKIPLKFTP